jgi:hypothetical protein
LHGGVDLLGQTDKDNPQAFEGANGINQMPQRPAQPVKTPDYDRVARTGVHEQVIQGRPGLQLPRGLVHEDSVTAGGMQGI